VARDMATFQGLRHQSDGGAACAQTSETSLVLHNSKYEAAVPLDVKVSGLTVFVISRASA